jgi:hypothetical protein
MGKANIMGYNPATAEKVHVGVARNIFLGEGGGNKKLPYKLPVKKISGWTLAFRISDSGNN